VHQFFTRLKTPLYAIIDTARDRQAFSVLETADCHYEILYPPRLAFDMDDRGPHLVSVRPGSFCLELLINAGWGNSWGIYLAGPGDFVAVRRHLQRLLFVHLHDGRQALFRFYDPRVLRDYLPNCSEAKLDQFFGPLTTIYLESGNGQDLHSFSMDRSCKTDNPPHPERLLEYRLKLS
jgi:hypothetical protein